MRTTLRTYLRCALRVLSQLSEFYELSGEYLSLLILIISFVHLGYLRDLGGNLKSFYSILLCVLRALGRGRAFSLRTPPPGFQPPVAVVSPPPIFSLSWSPPVF